MDLGFDAPEQPPKTMRQHAAAAFGLNPGWTELEDAPKECQAAMETPVVPNSH